LILASSSPRRRELLARLGVRFEVDMRSEVDEEAARGTAREVVRVLAARKAEDAWRRAVARGRGESLVVLAGDTVVALGEGREGERFGKPRGVAEAREMIRRLAGRTHAVWTGVALARAVPGDPAPAVPGDPAPTGPGDPAPTGPGDPAPGFEVEAEETRVTFRRLAAEEIERYLATGDHEGKAGAYGIQGAGAGLVESIHGCYYNVVGLPLAITARLLESAGIPARLVCDCDRHPLQCGPSGCGRAFRHGAGR
jgi:septum formation protein